MALLEEGRLAAAQQSATCWRWVSGLDEMDLALARCDGGHNASRRWSCDTVPRAAADHGSSLSRLSMAPPVNRRQAQGARRREPELPQCPPLVEELLISGRHGGRGTVRGGRA
jgi:hypothetical protein